MAHFIYDFDQVSYIVADAVGQPGKRTFFLQAQHRGRTATLIMEKQQVAALAASILQLLEELEENNPDLPPPLAGDDPLRLQEPLDPAFRVGQMGLGYDEDEDMMVLVAQALVATDEGELETGEDVPRARFFATRSQMRASRVSSSTTRANWTFTPASNPGWAWSALMAWRMSPSAA